MTRPPVFNTSPEQLLETARALRAQVAEAPQEAGAPTPMVIRYARLMEAIADPSAVEAQDVERGEATVVSAEEFEARRRRNSFKLV